MKAYSCNQAHDTDVAIVDAGSVGAMLATLLWL